MFTKRRWKNAVGEEVAHTNLLYQGKREHMEFRGPRVILSD